MRTPATSNQRVASRPERPTMRQAAALPGMRDRMGSDLMAAVKARDVTTVAALRSALAAIDNAAVVTVVPAQQHTIPTEHFAGAVTGLGTIEAERRMVSNVQVRALLQTQLDELLAAAGTFSQRGRHDRARQMQAEADVLRRYLLAPE